VSVLYAQAQSLAFNQARTNLDHPAAHQRGRIGSVADRRNNFIQPTVNALGYTLTDFTLRWAGAS